MNMSNKPVVAVWSFEAFINDAFPLLLASTFDGLTTGGYKPPVYDVSNFEERVRKKLSGLKDVGIGGIIAHYDFTDDYLEGEDGWRRFLTGLRVAVDLGLRVWIYDEKGYPSGTAGGKVLEGHPELEAVGLKHLSVEKAHASTTITLPDLRATIHSTFVAYPDGRREFLSGKTPGRVVELPKGEFKTLDIYFIAPLYEGTFAAAAGHRRYINLLDRRAVNRFLQVTHVKYFERIPADLWRNVDAFFTDEPALQAHAQPPFKLPFEEDPLDIDLPTYPSVPWSYELESRFFNEHGYPLEKRAPSLFAGHEEEDREVRRDFWETVSRLYVSAFSRQASSICSALGVDNNGHMLGEETLLQQVILHGSLLQALKGFSRPGVDLLTCRLENFHYHLLTHKTALSASFFGTGKGLMSETSDYFESMSLDNKILLPADHIKCIIALQYLSGVRNFCFLFGLKSERFTTEVIREIYGSAARMVEFGEGSKYLTECALYYPIEKVWEEYVPTYPCGDVTCAGSAVSQGRTVGEGSPELQALDRLTTETVKRLFYDNVQYVLCERPDIGCLPERGIKDLAYYGPGEPESDLKLLCEDVGVNLIALADFEKQRSQEKGIQAGSKVVYATYDRFVFAVNMGNDPSFIAIHAATKAIFPLTGNRCRQVEGRVELPPLACVFLI